MVIYSQCTKLSDQIKNPILLKQVQAFIGQEAHHGKEHNVLNAAMLKKGSPVDRIYKRFKKRFSQKD